MRGFQNGGVYSKKTQKDNQVMDSVLRFVKPIVFAKNLANLVTIIQIKRGMDPKIGIDGYWRRF